MYEEKNFELQSKGFSGRKARAELKNSNSIVNSLSPSLINPSLNESKTSTKNWFEFEAKAKEERARIEKKERDGVREEGRTMM